MLFRSKYCTSSNLNSMRWLGLFTNKTFRKYRKLIFPHWDFIICIVSLAIVHPHFSIRISSSVIFRPHFSIRILSSSFYHPHFSIHHPPSATIRFALYRDPKKFSCFANKLRPQTHNHNHLGSQVTEHFFKTPFFIK